MFPFSMTTPSAALKIERAYLFERFPSYTQTFCYREVAQMLAGGMELEIYAIRRRDEIPADCPEEVTRRITYLPEPETLMAEVDAAVRDGSLTGRAALGPAKLAGGSDRLRVYEAIWLGSRLRAGSVRHLHIHFAGLAARTAWWLKELYAISYSFTGHANDIFCPREFPVSLRDLVRDAAFVATVADFSRDGLRRQFPESAAKIHRVYNGIDPSLFTPAVPVAGLPEILSVGRCIEKKGFADLIEASAILHRRGLAFRTTIIGGGPLEEELRAQVARLGLEGVVTLTGAMSQAQVCERLPQATLFALACATEHDGGMDNLPTVIAEAMATGLPVVSTRLAGVPEMVEEGVTGLLVGEREPEALAAALEELLRHPEKAREMGVAGAARVRERFALEVTTAQLAALIDNAVAAHQQAYPQWPIPQERPGWLERMARRIF